MRTRITDNGTQVTLHYICGYTREPVSDNYWTANTGGTVWLRSRGLDGRPHDYAVCKGLANRGSVLMADPGQLATVIRRELKRARDAEWRDRMKEASL